MATFNQILAGLRIFVDKGCGNQQGIGAEHEEIYIGADVELTEDEKATLIAAGWIYDEKWASWSHFV